MKNEPNIFIAAATVSLAETVSVSEAVAEGLVPPTHQELGFERIAVSNSEAGPEMAAEAARSAITKSELDPSEIGLVLHASHWFQGLDLWPSAAYVANESVGAHPFALDVQQQSLGGLGAMRLASAYLRSGFTHAALVTTGDRYASPGIDRWNTLDNIIFGDAGTAVVLSTESGFARIVSFAVGADNSLERVTRGTTDFAPAPGMRQPVPVPERTQQFFTLPEAPAAWGQYEKGLFACHDQALSEAGVGPRDIRHAVVPFLHRGGGLTENYEILGYTEEQSLWSYGRTVGHLGAGDQAAGLAYLRENGKLASGDLVMLVGAGIGFNFAATVLEII
ncbi:3-oxoacyl-[acyl-carrier-protein] synthase-3 [Streptomyces misionensis]|uniref:3-oxoacyl-[acyl-carrier-protein] synthase-3 n=1 Tax=Streptomyces misionensis TaxID=67331 RepID=A0A1H5HIF5_9ACTN|nr:3-oxoacyl-[acyl-carrier-protein] synthase-3 [Streptomyces misionensis]